MSDTTPFKIVKQEAVYNAEAVSRAEELLQRCKSGEFESVIICAFRPDGTWLEIVSAGKTTLEKIGALTVIIDSYVRHVKNP